MEAQSEQATGPRPRLSAADAKALRDYIRLSGSFTHSTYGSMVEKAKFGSVMRDGKEVRVSKAYPRAPIPRVEHGVIMWADCEITAAPKKPFGDVSCVEARDMTFNQLEDYATVSRQLQKLSVVHIGAMQLPAADVLAAFMLFGRDDEDLASEACDCDSVTHLTGAFAALALEVRTQAADVVARACHRHTLKGREAAFVGAVDVAGNVGRHHAAIAAGYDAGKAHETANELSAKPAIAAAIKMREKAVAINALTNDWQLANELRKRRSVGDLTPGHKEQLRIAEAEARELMREACRAWNAVRVGGGA